MAHVRLPPLLPKFSAKQTMEQYIGPLILLGIVLFITLILYITADASLKELRPRLGLRIFLVFLRLVIGWHLAVEGWNKVHDNPNWTSAGYVQRASGPLGKYFRKSRVDDLFAKLTLTKEDKISPALNAEYQRYFDAFAAHYELSDEQKTKAKLMMDQHKEKTAKWLKDERWEPFWAPYLPANVSKKKMNMADRIAYYKKVADKLEHAEATDIPQFGAGAEQKIKNLFDEQNLILGMQSELKSRLYSMNRSKPGFAGELYNSSKVLNSDQKTDNPPAPAFAPRPPFSEMSRLQWADLLIPWALLITGLSLLGGFLTRPMCVVGALLLLMFFAAMPPIPGWPENPMAEGHYLYVNKNIIEMIALLALATTASGRWFGLDGLLHLLNPFRGRDSGPRETSPAPQPKPATVQPIGSGTGSKPHEIIISGKEN